MRTDLNFPVVEADKCKSGAGGWERGGRRRRRKKAVGDFQGLLQCEERTNLEGENSLGPTRRKPENLVIPWSDLVGANESGGTN